MGAELEGESRLLMWKGNRTHRAHTPERQALRKNAKAKERAARDPTLARPSTPLPVGRELWTTHRGVVRTD